MRFRLNTLKGTASATDMNLLKTNNLRGTKSAFLTPEMYHEHPPFFLYGRPRASPSPPSTFQESMNFTNRFVLL